MTLNNRLTNDYLNFDLLITRAGEGYRAYVVDAPGGDASVAFDLPAAALARGRLVHGEGTRRGVRLISGPATPPPPSLRAQGGLLFETIFREGVRSVLIASQSEAQAAGRDLRIRLRFSEDAVQLATLPWEILFDAEQQHFLALSTARPILRYLSLPRPRPALVVQPPLSILAVLASPTDHHALNIDQEWQAIEAALADLRTNDKIRLERLATPTFDALRARLLGEPVHVLHFIGHGVYNVGEGEGQLLFEDSRGKGDRVPAKAVAMLLHNHPSLRLAYLNACEGAIADHGNVFAGVAQTLVQQGVPAAVAMQDEISDEAAIEMARTFYTALATGRPVDAALSHARVALATRDNDEWAIPVLFSRSPDNRLFDVVEVLPTPTCPYPGMRPFTTEQADKFFGRDREIADAVNRLAQHPFLTVIGPSGSGKSSLAYAGLIPALRKAGRFGDGDWTVKLMRPSDSRTADGKAAPLAALRALLPGLASPLPSPAPELVEGKGEGRGEATASQAAPELVEGRASPRYIEGRTLLFIDQFEELFTLADAGEAAHFLKALHTLMQTPNLYILLTVRADFYPELMAMGPLWEAVKANRLELTPLGDDELWAAIVQPAAAVGVTVDEALVVELIHDAAGEAGVLPLVQETLVLLWEKVASRQLKLKAYQAMADGGRSGIQVAIDRRASVVYNNLPAAAQPIAHRIFLRLIQFGEGRADTRRQQTVAELRAGGDDPVSFAETLRTLTDSRLLTTSGEEGDPNRRVDISHEALIGGWALLQAWIGEKRVAESTRRRLEEKATDWLNTDKRSGLLNAFDLQEAKRWQAGADAAELGVSTDLATLIDESAQALQAEERAKRNQRLFAGAAVLAIVLLIIGALFIDNRGQQVQIAIQATAAAKQATSAAVIAAGAAQAAKDAGELAVRATEVATAEIGAQQEAKAAQTAEAKAEGEARIAKARQLAAQSASALAANNSELALALAIEAGHTADVLEAFSAIRAALAQPGRSHRVLYGHTAIVWQATWSQDARKVLTSSEDGSARIWDADSGTELVALQGHTGSVNEATWSQDERKVLTSSSDGTARIWDAASGTELVALQGNTDNVLQATWSQDERKVLTSSADGTARIWDAASGTELVALQGHTESINEATWSQDERKVLTSSADGTARIWDADSGTELVVLQGHTDDVRQATWSQDELKVLTGSDDGSARIWDAESGTELVALQGHTASVIEAIWSQDERKVLTRSYDGSVRIWDIERGTELVALQGHTGSVWQATWSQDERKVLTRSDDGTPRIWDAASGAELVALQGHTGSVWEATWSQDEHKILTSSSDGSARIWDADSGTELVALQGHTGSVWQATWSQDERKVLTRSADGPARIWDAASGAELVALQGHTESVWHARWSQDERKVLTINYDGTARIWDAESGTELVALQGHTRSINEATWSQDERKVLTSGNDGTARIWDVASGTELVVLQGHTDSVWQATWSQDERKVLTSSADATARIWDAASGAELVVLQGHTDDVNEAMWSQDERKVLTRSDDNTVRIWDATSGTELVALQGHTDSVNEATWSQDERKVLTRSDDGTARIWDAASGTELVALQGHTGSVRQATWSQDERKVLTRSDDGTPRIWYTRMADLIIAACAKTPRNLALDEWRRLSDQSYRTTCEKAPIPPQTIAAIQDQVVQLAQSGHIVTATAKLDELNSWLQTNGQYARFGKESRIFVADVLVEQGRTLTQAGQLEAALAKFTEAAALDETLNVAALTAEATALAVAALVEQGHDLAQEGQLEEALASSAEAAALDETLDLVALTAEAKQIVAALVLEDGRTLAQEGQLAEALAKFGEAAVLDETLDVAALTVEAKQIVAAPLVEEGRNLAQEGDLEAALAKFAEAAALDKTLDMAALTVEATALAVAVLVEEGRELAQAGQLEEALAKFAEAAMLDKTLDVEALTAEAERLAAAAQLAQSFEQVRTLAQEEDFAAAGARLNDLAEQTPLLTAAVPVTATTALTPLWRFAGRAGQTVTLAMVDTEDGSFDPYLTVLKPNGEFLAEDDDSGEGSDGYDALIANVLLPEDGVYFVLAGRAGSDGAYQLTLTIDEQLATPTPVAPAP